MSQSKTNIQPYKHAHTIATELILSFMVI